MSNPSFANLTPLHLHSHYSLLESTVDIPTLIEQATAAQLTHLALTDSNALYGAVVFSQACHTAGIQPILGLTLTITTPLDSPYTPTGKLLLLAQNREGYRSLCHLSSYLQADPERDTRLAQGVPWETLSQYTAGLFAIDAGQQGLIYRFLAQREQNQAASYAAQLAQLFNGRSFVGLEWHTAAEHRLLHEITALGHTAGLPPIAAQPVYTLTKQEQPLLKLLSAIDQNLPLTEVPLTALPAYGRTEAILHWQTPHELAQHFAEFPEALENVSRLTAACEPSLPDGQTIWPALPLGQQTAAQALQQQAQRGLQQHFGDNPAPAVKTRLQHELDTINTYGFAPLFLIVADVVAFARQHDIPVSTRGSVANSLVAYCLGISTVDPILHDLLFERFLNPARANLPDIDLDFCSRRRDEVLGYVSQKYGQDQVALVATINTLQNKSAVREVGKAYGLEETQIKQLSGRIKNSWHPDPRRRVTQTNEEILAGISDPRERLAMQDALRLVGQPHHLSVHPGGVVITPTPLADTVPIQWATKGFRITQFDHDDVERIGLPKLDLLGIRALTVLADAAELVRHTVNPSFTLADIPLSDAPTAAVLEKGDTIGVFQCESTGAQRTLRQLNVHNIQDLAVANAFFKPGPATGGMAAAFIRRYRGEEKVSFLHEKLIPILKSTQGVLLFQEQILRVAREIAGLSWAEADHLRRGMSKFKAAEMRALQEAFVQGCQSTAGFAPAQAQTLWEQVLAFAGYGFNQGHATAYADISYRSAYIRTHWPAQFLAARLANGGGFHHPAIYMAEARRLGIAVRPPHINHSGRKFILTIDEAGQETLWMGLSWVRSLRRTAVREILKQRPFTSLTDLLVRVQLQSKEVQYLIQCGALDGLGENRAALLRAAQQAERGQPRQLSLFAATAAPVPPETAAERVTWEKHVLGFPVSTFPLEDDLPAAEVTPFKEVVHSNGRLVTIHIMRLPGWTGGRGVYIGDDNFFAVAGGNPQLLEKLPRPWGTATLSGRWRVDQWGGEWFQIEAILGS